MNRRLVQNAARCKHCGTLVVSTHRHDYRPHVCNGREFAVDGGLDYVRRTYDRYPPPYEDECKYEELPNTPVNVTR